MRKKLSAHDIKTAEYQDLPLESLVQQYRNGELSQAQYGRKRDRLLSPYGYVGSDGRKRWKRYVIWDTHRDSPRGFGLRISEDGKRTFIYSYRFRGRKRLMVLGEVGELVPAPNGGEDEFIPLTLSNARKVARHYKAQVDADIDPLARRRQRRVKPDEDLTMRQLCLDFLENHAKQYKRESSWKEDERRLKRYVIGADDAKEQGRPAIGKQLADTVTDAQIDTLAQKIGKRAPIESNRVVILLATVYAWAIRKGKLPGTFPNPAQRSKKDLYREEARVRILKSDERPKLIAAIDKEPNPYHRALFRLLLLTGLRKSELLHAKHTDLDLGDKTLHLPKTKSGKPRIVPLSHEAIQIIRELPRCVGNDHLFPAHRAEYLLDRETGERNFHLEYRSGNQPMSDPKKQWRRVRKAAGCDDLRIHDLRRSASYTVIKATGNPRAAQKVLGHADLSTTLRHYASVTDQETRAAVEALSHVLNGEG